MAKEKYTTLQVIDALKVTKGMIYLAADRLSCHPDTIYNYAKRYRSVQAEIANQRGRLVDIAELKLHQAVMDGELGAVKYVLSTLGKERGYVEQHDLRHSGEISTRIIEGPNPNVR